MTRFPNARDAVRAIEHGMADIAKTISDLGIRFADSRPEALAMLNGFAPKDIEFEKLVFANTYGIVIRDIANQIEKSESLSERIDYGHAFRSAAEQMPGVPDLSIPKEYFHKPWQSGNTVDMAIHAVRNLGIHAAPASYVICLGEFLSNMGQGFVLDEERAARWKTIVENDNPENHGLACAALESMISGIVGEEEPEDGFNTETRQQPQIRTIPMREQECGSRMGFRG